MSQTRHIKQSNTHTLLPLTSTLSIESLDDSEEANLLEDKFFTPDEKVEDKRALRNVILSEMNGVVSIILKFNS